MVTTNQKLPSPSSASLAKGRRSRRCRLAGLTLAALTMGLLLTLLPPPSTANAQGCFDPLG
ncbi:MAG: hypothetical protein HW404_396, partial [Anaerolineales bacterium]|nr:hypothetical protein [Anaerolineales bacterium]